MAAEARRAQALAEQDAAATAKPTLPRDDALMDVPREHPGKLGPCESVETVETVETVAAQGYS